MNLLGGRKGVYETAGNVLEWVRDGYKGNYVDTPSHGSVWEQGECAYRVIWGRAYDSPADSLSSSARNNRRPATTYDVVGIRLARDIKI